MANRTDQSAAAHLRVADHADTAFRWRMQARFSFLMFVKTQNLSHFNGLRSMRPLALRIVLKIQSEE